MSNREIVRDSVVEVLIEQPWFQRRKDTLLQAAQAIGWVAAIIAPILTSLPSWVSLIIGGLAYLSTGITTAYTKGAIPPSAAERIAAKAAEAEKAEEASADALTYEEVLAQRYEEVGDA